MPHPRTAEWTRNLRRSSRQRLVCASSARGAVRMLKCRFSHGPTALSTVAHATKRTNQNARAKGGNNFIFISYGGTP